MSKSDSSTKRNLSRRVSAFLNPEKVGGQDEGLKNASRKLASKDEEITRLKAMLDERDTSIDVRNIVWVLGAGRTGSTWLAAMVEEMNGQRVWFEPRLGLLFDPHRFSTYKGRDFILSEHHRKVWIASIRSFALTGAAARFPDMSREDYLVIKEPSGSVGATWLMEAMPESRMVLLVRDPRDYAASWLDAHRKGSWQSERRQNDQRKNEKSADENPDEFVRRLSKGYMKLIGSSKEAYDSHEGPKTLVRYEDLRADTPTTMKRMYTELSIEVDEGELARSVAKHSWENIPEDKKGDGKFYRKASPGGWREDLTPGQAKIVEEITEPLIREFYPS